MANFKKGKAKADAAKKGHRNTTKAKSHAGIRKAGRKSAKKRKK